MHTIGVNRPTIVCEILLFCLLSSIPAFFALFLEKKSLKIAILISTIRTIHAQKLWEMNMACSKKCNFA